MRLRAGGPSSRAESRATKTTTYEDTGTANENYIDLDKVHVFLYDNFIPGNNVNGRDYLYGKSLNIELEPTTKEVVDLEMVNTRLLAMFPRRVSVIRSA
jgi:hypothetical protein